MEQAIRKAFFGLSFLGLLTGLLAWSASFWGLQLQARIFLLFFTLHLGAILTYGALFIMEREIIRSGKLYHIYPEAVRTGIRRATYVLFVLFLSQFVLLLVLTRGRAIEARNGEFQLGGETAKVISKAEYDRLKSYELRMFASGWVLMYFVTAAYWWFPRQRYLILPTAMGEPAKQ